MTSPYDTYTSPLATRNASEEMLRLWSPRHKFNTWRRIWLAVAEAQHELGLPVTKEQVEELRAVVDRPGGITDEEIREALSDAVSTIINAVRVALERTPPELSADIVERGIVLTGGGALLKNLDKRLTIETGLPVVISDDPLSSVVLGTGKMLSDFELLKRVKWDNSLMTGS